MYTDSNLTVSSWVAIRGGCPIRYRVNANDDVEFAFGELSDCFEFLFDANALRQFLEVGSKALAEMNAHEAADQARPGA